MRFHGSVWGGSLLVTATALILSAGGPADSAAAPQAAAACVPRITNGVLPDPLTVVPAASHETVTLYAVQNGAAYCYTTDPTRWDRYVDAPTIQVTQGERFTIVLKNQLAQPSATGGMQAMKGMTGDSPQPAPTTPDGCAQLAAGDGTPAPTTTGELGPVGRPAPRAYVEIVHPPGDTNLHTHGLHVRPIIDNVFRSTQGTAGMTCTQTFTIRVSQPAGTYWYHAHLHGIANTQVGGGFAGALIVLPKNAPPEPPTRVILIKNAPLATAAPAVRFAPRRVGLNAAPPRAVPSLGPNQFISGMRPAQGAVPCPSASPGQSIAVNGYTIGGAQLSSPPRDPLGSGQQQKLRIIDATANAYIDVALVDGAGHREPLTVVGRDGVPINPSSDVENVALPGNPTDVQLPPGGRVDIIVTGTATDQTLISAPVCTGFAGPDSVSYKLATIGIGVSGVRALVRRPPIAVTTARPHATRAEVARAHHGRVVVERWLSFTQYDDGSFYVTAGNPRGPGIVENPFWLARSSTPSNPGYYLQPNIETRQGNVELWHLVNAAPEIHAFHIHQLTFLGISSSVPDQRARIANVRLDTLLLPPATQTGRVTSDGYPILQATQTDILIDFGQVDPGTFVYHCHMLYHEDHGMMGIIRVDPAG